MGISYKELISNVEKIAPKELEETWDNCGIQINVAKEEINKILIALEITKEVITEAKELNADFIITHHPLIFNRLNMVDNNSVIGSYVIELIKAGISVYSAHTTFDSVVGGNNDYMAELIGLQKVKFFESKNPAEHIIGRFGELKENVTLQELCRHICNVLNISDGIKVVGEPNKLIKRIGLCTGAGGDIITHAIEYNCDLFITGDVSYHEAQNAKESGICIIDAGHYGTEKIFVENFAKKLKNLIGTNIQIFLSKKDLNPFRFML
ncbi:Nif3-like dinuclear metal center hexameric protein [Anaerovorax odorimutans]|uniref:Nif3-like dinuclear metal center hexameric protein n=1 Tax=Anaerovorax odorimutans TaxID=109327 RepID=UPI0004125FAA|nr:Nif3-like dinuclear metal center hexameric protein [Anaerovorax odorimutans]